MRKPSVTLQLMGEIHEGHFGAHMLGPTVKWLIIQHRYYWPTDANCYHYTKECKECQKYGSLKKGWAMDVVGKIYLNSSKRHSFILVITNYFMKWVEAGPWVSVIMILWHWNCSLHAYENLIANIFCIKKISHVRLILAMVA